MSDHLVPRDGEGTAVSAAREKAVEILKECFARSLCSLEEYEERVGRVEAAGSLREIDAVLREIPQEVRALCASAGAAARSGLPFGPEVQRIRTVMGSRTYRGNWLASRSVELRCIMAETVLDFRDVELPRGRIEVQVLCVMCSLEILVPPEVRVEIESSPVFAEVEEHGGRSPDAPETTIVVRGPIVFAGVEIRYR